MVKMQEYLDKALVVLDKYGIINTDEDDSKLAGLLEEVASVDEAKVLAIAKTLKHTTAFNQLVRDNVQEMNVGDRYGKITSMFDSIREDYKGLIEQLDDGKIDFKERVSNWWMHITRDWPHERFEEICDIYNEVADDTLEQLEKEKTIMDAYMDFRFAMKDAEILASEVYTKQEGILEDARAAHDTAQKAVDEYKGTNETSRLELEKARDEAFRTFKEEDRKYQLIKDVAENLKIGYNVGETLVAKLDQTHQVKDRLYNRAVTFFGTNEHVFTLLSAVYGSQHGLHETTQSIEAMEEGANKAIEDVADLGRQLEKAALKAGYGATISPQSVQKLVDSVVSFQTESIQLIDEYRQEATEAAAEIETIVEEGKQKCRDAITHYTA